MNLSEIAGWAVTGPFAIDIDRPEDFDAVISADGHICALRRALGDIRASDTSVRWYRLDGPMQAISASTNPGLSADIKRLPAPIPGPMPRDQWPLWASAIAKLATDEDTGVGDTIHRMLGRFGEKFKAKLKKWGTPCGCDKRQVEWNTLYPYSDATPIGSEPAIARSQAG